MAWASGLVLTSRLLKSWAVVYLGNFVGGLGTAVGVYLSRQWTFDAYRVGATALTIADAKVQHDFLSAFALGAFCNALVCLAVWLCFSARTTMDKIVAIVPPITAFVAAGFEHSVANMYFIPLGLWLQHQPLVVEMAGHGPEALADLTWRHFFVHNLLFFVHNLLPVTLGNVVGGTVMVAGVYVGWNL
jgi:formate transporter